MIGRSFSRKFQCLYFIIFIYLLFKCVIVFKTTFSIFTYDSTIKILSTKAKLEISTKTSYLFLVLSRYDDMNRRKMVREIWMNKHLNRHQNYEFKFIVGLPTSPKDLENIKAVVKEENEAYNDIIVLDMVDSYENLTLKVIKGFEWVINTIHTNKHYNNVQYLIKVDDNYLVYVDNLLDYLDNKKVEYYGYIRYNDIVVRDTLDKNYINEADYEDNMYKPYATGPCYVLSIKSVHKILAQSKHIPMWKNEDTYVGYISFIESIEPKHDRRFNNDSIYRRVKFHRLCSIMDWFGIHIVPPDEYNSIKANYLRVIHFKIRKGDKCLTRYINAIN